VGAAVGTDGGGSIRIPSAYCGVTGMKSTFGGVPTDGYTHAFSSVGAAGPMCRDAADARLFGEVLLGRALQAQDGAGLRAGVVRSPFWEDLDPEVESACRAVLDAAGWPVVEVEIAGAEHTLIATVLRLTLETLPEMREEELEEADAVMRALFKYQLLLPAEGLVRADRVRSQLRRSAAAAFERCDALIWPTVPAPAPTIENPSVEVPSGTLPADPANVRLTGFGNLTGLPGASVPVGVHSSGLPIGLQVQAPWGGESVVLDAAEHLERATDREHVNAVPPVAAEAGRTG
jgi:Asp-tRNA(Asn)/Glu-tRNA(Gln) amidotransferase A subunit family amidase